MSTPQTLPSMTAVYPGDKPTPNIPQLLTQKEAAVILRKPPRWLERKRQEGGGPPFRYIGRTPVYLLEDLLTWIAEQPVIKHTSNDLN